MQGIKLGAGDRVWDKKTMWSLVWLLTSLSSGRDGHTRKYTVTHHIVDDARKESAGNVLVCLDCHNKIP